MGVASSRRVQATARTGWVWPAKAVRCWPVRRSQTITSPQPAPVMAIGVPSSRRVQATARTGWVSAGQDGALLAGAQVPDDHLTGVAEAAGRAPLMAMGVPSSRRVQATARTGWVWPARMVRCWPVRRSQTITSPPPM